MKYDLRNIALTALAYLAIALTLALLLFRCSKEDPKPVFKDFKHAKVREFK